MPADRNTRTDNFPAVVRIAWPNTDCEHCGGPIDIGFFEFQLLDAWHGVEECHHWLCLRCTSGVVKTWTRSAGLTYRPTP